MYVDPSQRCVRIDSMDFENGYLCHPSSFFLIFILIFRLFVLFHWFYGIYTSMPFQHSLTPVHLKFISKNTHCNHPSVFTLRSDAIRFGRHTYPLAVSYAQLDAVNIDDEYQTLTSPS